jgi:7-cyano-7-deazaguanine synthase
MSTVALVSGGLDSTLVALLAKEAGVALHPLFIDYGQRARDRELDACRRAMRRLALPEPKVADLAGYGDLVRSGLTDKRLRVYEDAFTPGRNTLFLLVAAAYAAQVGADAVSIGLLNEDASLFPDQTRRFVSSVEAMIELAVGRPVRILVPLADFHKRDVVALAKAKGIDGTYSCHLGEEIPCGHCIACLEFNFDGGSDGRK